MRADWLWWSLAVLAVGLVGIGGLREATASKIVWTNAASGKIQSANLDSSGIQDLITVPTPVSIALDVASGKMYWITP